MNDIPLKAGLPPMPDRIARLPRDPRGFPIPWFVHVDEHGTADFRVIHPHRMAQAYNRKRCWVCGEPLGKRMAFCIGPMCAITRTMPEPGACHRTCAEWSAKACPFLSKPRMRRNEKDLPVDGTKAAGIPLDRNPGVACVWISDSYSPFRTHNGVLFKVGDPTEVLWFCEGRAATREEVLHSIKTGLPILAKLAKDDGPKAVDELTTRVGALGRWLPKGAAPLEVAGP
jgi:hypothetical protein